MLSFYVRSLGLRRIVAHLPYSKKGANTQNYERKDDGTDDFTELPSNLFDAPLAAFVESDHSRHHGLHITAEGCGTRQWGTYRGILCALVGSFRFGISLWGYATISSSKGDDGRTESD
jgi:hypothetical protein